MLSKYSQPLWDNTCPLWSLGMILFDFVNFTGTRLEEASRKKYRNVLSTTRKNLGLEQISWPEDLVAKA